MGRDKRNEGRGEHFTKMIRTTMETPAWRALSCTAQALYPHLKLEWRGPDANNNGKIRLSVRQASERLGVRPNTAARAFHDLQAKGFIVVTEHARLGVDGAACAPAFEITEIKLPHSNKNDGRKLYRDWRPGQDYPVHAARANNPRGINGKRKSADGSVVQFNPKK
ncbi:hypothetical protein [Alkalilacustris brevis]|uniref:hypothetical protein n=1 Tax=Alkalilacustris brevis TaxID=2026338 RepID=UPI000E0DE85F|nr:hypothetical protein [Alkalilacustris brevis]